MKMNKRIWMVGILFTIHCSLFIGSIAAQDKIVNPDISYAGTPRTCEIGGLAVKGVEGYEDYVLICQAQRLLTPSSAIGSMACSQRYLSRPTPLLVQRFIFVLIWLLVRVSAPSTTTD